LEKLSGTAFEDIHKVQTCLLKGALDRSPRSPGNSRNFGDIKSLDAKPRQQAGLGR
jgi:hypothetical protein